MNAFGLDDARRGALLDIAERAIGEALATGRVELLDGRLVDDVELRRHGAAFVTLLRGQRLLGCVGSLHAVEPIATAVHRAALQAAFADPRLPEVTIDDFEVMTVKVSALSALEPIAVHSYDELARDVGPGVDGLVIDAPNHRATLLPSVWEQCGTVDDFLTALWSKAGLPTRLWPPGLHVQRYTTEEFASYGPRRLAATPDVM